MRILRLIALALLAPQLARAQAVNADADALFRQGRDLMLEGKFVDACTAFDASEKLDPAITTMLNLADCREKNGQLATAWAEFLDAERRTRGAQDAASARLHAVASDHAQKLDSRLSKLEIRAAKLEGLVITRNGVAVDASVLGRALPVDGGTYEVSATAPDHEGWKTTITVAAEHDAKVVEVPALRAIARPPVVRITPPTASPVTDHHTLHTISIAAMVAGGGAVATGLVFGALARSKWTAAVAVCGPSLECDNGPDLARARSLATSASSRGSISTITTAAGGAVVVTGLAMWWLTRNHDEHSSVALAVDPTYAGVEVHARF